MPGPGLVIERMDGPAAFLETAGEALRAREVEHDLILGIAADALADPARYGEPLFLLVRRTDEPGVPGPIALAALRTPPFNLLVSSLLAPDDRLGAAVDTLAAALVAVDPGLPGVIGPAAVAGAFAAAWSRRTGGVATISMHERLFRLDRAIAPERPAAGRARWAEARDLPLVAEWLRAFRLESQPDEPLAPDFDREARRWIDPALAAERRLRLWEAEGRVVAFAGTNRASGRGVRIGPVYTPPPERGRGYGSAVTHAATVASLEAGAAWACLFTDLANPTSNAIYRRIGYEPVGDVDLYRFTPPERSR